MGNLICFYQTKVRLLLTIALLLVPIGLAQAIDTVAPDFKLLNAEAQVTGVSDFLGTPLILNFWASWCPPCVEELAFIEQVMQDVNAASAEPKLNVLLVNNGENAEWAKTFIGQELAIDLALALEPNRDQIAYYKAQGIKLNSSLDVVKAYRVRGMPSSFFIDATGTIKAIKVGILLPAEMPQLLASIGLDWQPAQE